MELHRSPEPAREAYHEALEAAHPSSVERAWRRGRFDRGLRLAHELQYHVRTLEGLDLLDMGMSHGGDTAALASQGARVTGSWGEFRQELFRRYGLAIAAGYGGQLVGNPVGGERQGISYDQYAATSLFVDLDRFMGWKDGYFVASMNTNWGKVFPRRTSGTSFLCSPSRRIPVSAWRTSR